MSPSFSKLVLATVALLLLALAGTVAFCYFDPAEQALARAVRWSVE